MKLPQKLGSFTLIRELADDGITRSFLGIMDHPAGKRVNVRQVIPYVSKDPKRLAEIRLRVGDLLHLEHPNLQRVIDFHLIGNCFYIIEERREGVSLQALLQWCRGHQRALPHNIFLHIIANLCTALEALHSTAGRDSRTANLLHLGIRPSSVTISPTGEIVLGEYGLVNSPPTLQHAMGSSHELKHLRYLAPEQTHADAKVSPVSDLFSMGSLFYELLTVTPLFDASTQLQTIHAIRKAEVSGALAEVKNLFPGFDKVLYRSLSLNPRHRYQRAFVLREDIRGLMAKYSFSHVKEELIEFIHPISRSDQRVSTFPDAFGPAPVESDDTNAILRSALGIEAWEEDDAKGEDTLHRAPTAETFAFLGPSSSQEPHAPEQDDSSEEDTYVGPVDSDSGQFSLDPLDVPEPAGFQSPTKDASDHVSVDTTWFPVENSPSAMPIHDFGPKPKEVENLQAASPDTLPIPEPQPLPSTPVKPRIAEETTAGLTEETTASLKEDSTAGLANETTASMQPLSENWQDTKDSHRGRTGLFMAAGAVTAVLLLVVLAIIGVGTLLVLNSTNSEGQLVQKTKPPIAKPALDPTPKEDPTVSSSPKVEESGGGTTGSKAPIRPEKANVIRESSRAEAPVSPRGESDLTPPVAVASKPTTSTVIEREDDILLDEDPVPNNLFLGEILETEGVPQEPGVPDYKTKAAAGTLTQTDIETLESTPTADSSFTYNYTLLYSNAKAQDDRRDQRKYLESMMILAENQRNPTLLVERAQLAIYRKDYEGALKHANLAERHWARIPSSLMFSRKAMIYETQAAAWQGKFYQSGGEDLSACHRSIRSWERYRQHVATQNRRDLVAVADQRLFQLRDARKRLE